MEEKWVVYLKEKSESCLAVKVAHHRLDYAMNDALKIAAKNHGFKTIEIKHWVFSLKKGWHIVPEDSLFVRKGGGGFTKSPLKNFQSGSIGGGKRVASSKFQGNALVKSE